ncbi:MAG: alanine racemase [Marinobacter sp.]|uniref:alanine racemase n=1 Tax=Marinobacter sp. TaxID=50741 RepID=UPI00396DEA38
MARPAIAEIDLESISKNFQLASSLCPQGRTIAVVKADAYGHGIEEVSSALSGQAGAFATASIEEALTIRSAGLRHPILLLEGFFEFAELEEISMQGFWTAVHDEHQLEQLERATLPEPISVWLKIDTGMHRLGFDPGEALKVFRRLQSIPHVKNIVIMSHLANADAAVSQGISVESQILRLPREFIDSEIDTSLANSAGLLDHELARRNWQRPGIMLYGSSPLEVENHYSQQLQAAMTLKSKIIATRWIEPGEQVGYGGRFIASRRSRIGAVAIGYADGYPRQARDGTPVLVGGQRTRIVGRVSMDMLTVDLTDISNAHVGVDVELWGKNLPAKEVADCCNTIPYHLFTGVTKRVPRTYLGSPKTSSPIWP